MQGGRASVAIQPYHSVSIFNTPFSLCNYARCNYASVHRIIEITSFNGILVDVFDFLRHHCRVLYLLGMRAFFPVLITVVCFVRLFIKSESFQDTLSPLLLQHFEQAFCGL